MFYVYRFDSEIKLSKGLRTKPRQHMGITECTLSFNFTVTISFELTYMLFNLIFYRLSCNYALLTLSWVEIFASYGWCRQCCGSVDILVRTGYQYQWLTDPDPAVFSVADKMPTKNKLFFQSFLLITVLFKGTFTKKVKKKSQNSINQGFSYFFFVCWWKDPDLGAQNIRLLRIRIHNTGEDIRFSTKALAITEGLAFTSQELKSTLTERMISIAWSYPFHTG